MDICNELHQRAAIVGGEHGVAMIRAASAIQALRLALEKLCDEIELTELHGGGAYDDDCPTCEAIDSARKLLTPNGKLT